ncbi:MAG TPA: hypothetical protein VHH36_01800 [Candidatus Thermoplasmatota archaeon]|nr:hypothetical protein [Candidatus Thermoplasmatota archaeon]
MRRTAAALLAFLLAAPFAAGEDAAPDDCGTGIDAPETTTRAPVIASPADCRAAIAGGDVRDSYRFEAPPGMTARVRATPDEPGRSMVVSLYSPDHGDGAPARWIDFRFDEANATSREPGLWAIYVYMCVDGGACGVQGAYRLQIELEGAAWPSATWEGAFAVGHAGGTYAARAAPALADGVDGRWRDLPLRTTGVEFARLSWTGCKGPQCLQVAFTDEAGASVTGSGACGRETDLMGCFVPKGATRLFVAATAGADVRYEVAYWAPDLGPFTDAIG